VCGLYLSSAVTCGPQFVKDGENVELISDDEPSDLEDRLDSSLPGIADILSGRGPYCIDPAPATRCLPSPPQWKEFVLIERQCHYFQLMTSAIVCFLFIHGLLASAAALWRHGRSGILPHPVAPRHLPQPNPQPQSPTAPATAPCRCPEGRPQQAAGPPRGSHQRRPVLAHGPRMGRRNDRGAPHLLARCVSEWAPLVNIDTATKPH
jgi:hypothetical protein